MNFSLGEPHTCSTISGVYRAKCRFRIWNTQCGFWSVGSFSAGPGLSDRTRSSNGGPARFAIRSFVTGPGAFGPRLYAQLALSYRPSSPLYGQNAGSVNFTFPEKTPSRSSVSLNSSPMIVAALVKLTANSLKKGSVFHRLLLTT